MQNIKALFHIVLIDLINKMICLSCGFCCENMSPLNGGYCSLLKKEGNINYCSDYINRPIQCVNHSVSSEICVVGKNVLNIKTENEIKERINNIKYVLNNAHL
jgi:Fe-S-cluster containining protein